MQPKVWRLLFHAKCAFKCNKCISLHSEFGSNAYEPILQRQTANSKGWGIVTPRTLVYTIHTTLNDIIITNSASVFQYSLYQRENIMQKDYLIFKKCFSFSYHNFFLVFLIICAIKILYIFSSSDFCTKNTQLFGIFCCYSYHINGIKSYNENFSLNSAQ